MIFTHKDTFLIYLSHGEYDDHVEIPCFTMDDFDLASMFVDDLNKCLKTKNELYDMVKDFLIYVDKTDSFGIKIIDHLGIV